MDHSRGSYVVFGIAYGGVTTKICPLTLVASASSANAFQFFRMCAALTALRSLLRSTPTEKHAQDFLDSLHNGFPAAEIEDVSKLLEVLRPINSCRLYELMLLVAVEVIGACPNQWTNKVATMFCDTLRRRCFEVDVGTLAKLVDVCCRMCEAEAIRYLFYDCCSVLSQILLVPNQRVQESAATFTQVLCCSTLSIEAFICSGGCLSIASLLHSSSGTVLSKVLQTCHALSSDINFCQELSSCGVLPVLAVLAHRVELSTVVAGILQNIARDKSSGNVLSGSKVIESVSPLLFTSNPVAQASAIGFLLNMHEGSAQSRQALISALKSTVLEQCIVDSIF